MSNLDVAVNVISDKQTQLTVKVPVGTIQSKVESRIRSLAKTAKIDGFRKGKVPVSHIRAQYGAGIQQEVINDVIRDTVFQVLADKKVRAVGVPSIDDVKLENDFLVYQASVETMPEVQVKGLDEIEVERQVATVSDEDVDTMIENLQKQRQTFETKDGELGDGDEATFDFEGSIDGEKFEGGSAEDFRLVIGSGQMIPGFEDGMKGMKAGEERAIKVTFPEDYQAENLKGKEADFKISLKEVKEAKLPELNDEFFELFGVTEGGLDKLKTDVRKNMEREIKNAARNQVKQAAFDALVDNAAKETSDLNVRYERYAEAQAWLEDSSLFMPLMVNKGAAPMVARLTPFSGAYSQVGPKGSDRYFKYLEPQKDVVTKKNYDKARESWLKEKSKSNEKAQKDLEKHVK